MSPRAAAAAVARGAAATVDAPAPGRTRTAPQSAPPRRRSGAGAAVPSAPRYDFVAILDRLLRGPAYIAMVGILLAGIVFFNVDVLELNHGIARTDTRATQLKRDNAALTLQLAKLGASERIQRVALQHGLVLPQPGDVRYLRAHRQDAARALRVMTAPDRSGGVTPLQTGDSTAPAATAPAASTLAATAPATTTPTQAAPATTAPAQTAPATTAPVTTAPVTTAPAPTSTVAGATAAPATTVQTTP
jgi:cell division protein FtsL